MKFFRRLQYICLALFLTASGWAAAQTAVTLGGTRLVVQDVSADIHVQFRSMRLNRAQNVWNFEASLTNRGIRDIQGPFILVAESFSGTAGPLNPDGSDENSPPRPFFDFSATVPDLTLSPGEASAERTLALSRGTGTPQLVAKVFVPADQDAVALAFVRTLNSAGQPLPGVLIQQSGASTNTFESDANFAVASIGAGGQNSWKFSKPGFLPVWRQQLLIPGSVMVLPSPRLSERKSTPNPVTVLQGAQIKEDGITIQIPPGAVSQNTEATLSPLDGQTLPAFLPLGWSPLQAFWFESPEAITANATLSPWGVVRTDDVLVLAKWNETNLQWTVTHLLSGAGTNELTAQLVSPGAFVLAVADRSPTAPPTPQGGAPLAGSQFILPATSNLKATGTVSPSISSASRVPEMVTATAEVVITNSVAAIPSGLTFQANIRERYNLRDGSTRTPPSYNSFVIAYRHSSDANPTTVHARFPLRPIFLFGPEELNLATITVDILDAAQFDGAVLTETGGSVASGRVRIQAPAGAISGLQAIQLRLLNPADFLQIAQQNPVEAAFDLAVSGVVPGRQLLINLDSPAANANYVVARVVYEAGQFGLQPVERLVTSTSGVLTSAEPLSGPRLNGVFGAGQYLVIRVPSPQGMVQGIARNSAGVVAAGMPVRIAGQPWLDLSRPDGSFKLLAPAGVAEVSAVDPLSGDTAQASVTVINPQLPVNASLLSAAAGPIVALINPTNLAVNVPRISPIEISFNEPINPSTLLPSGIQLLGTNNQPVAATLTLNLRNTVATLLPNEPLEPSTLHSIRLSSNIADPTGLKIEGPTQFTFTTQSDLLDRSRAELVIYAPGSTNIPSEILDNIPAFVPGEEKDAIVVAGTPGAAEPKQSVILVNESTAETSTVLSLADGSFYGIIRGGEEDFISASIRNDNGTQTYLPVSRQRFDNGFVGLYKGGGILEAESEGGSIEVIVEPGSVNSRTKFKLDPLPLQQVLQALGNIQPEGGKVLGGIAYREELDPITAAADISFPVTVADIGLPPGTDPAQASFGLTVPTEINGVKVFQLIDTMQFEATEPGKGRLVTASPPFVGLLLRQITAMRQQTGTPNLLAQFTGNPFDIGFGSFGLQPVMSAVLVPIFMAPGPPAKMAGRVLALPEGTLVAQSVDATPVSGAFVKLRRTAAVGFGGLLAGDVFAVSDRDGKYAISVGKGLDSGPGFEIGFVVATHGGFPFQAPTAPFTTALLTKADLFFEKVGGPVPGVTDTVPPVVRVTQKPLSPGSGLGADDGAILEISASDDFRVSNIEVIPEDFRTLAGDAPLEASLLQTPELIEEITGDQARMLRRFRVRAKEPGRAVYMISAVDTAGNRSFAPYAVTFRSAPGPVEDVPNRVLFTWPPHNSENIPAATPVTLRFTNPLTPEQIANPTWITFQPSDAYQLTRLEAASGGREITIHYANSGASVSVDTLGLSISTDIATQFGTGGASGGAFQYSITFAPSVQTIPMTPGGGGPIVSRGTLLVGNFVYVLGVREQQGVLQQFRFVGPGFPAEEGPEEVKLEFVAETTFPGIPTEMVQMPHYALRRQNGQVVPPATYIAVFEGRASETKVVKLFRVAPLTGALERVTSVSGVITDEPAQILKAKWDAPFIGLFELGAGATSIKLMNLNALFVGLEARAVGQPLSIFPAGGAAGVDTNNDGDFADAGETAPLPDGEAVGNLGVEFSLAAQNADDRIVDFDLSADFGLVAAAVRGINGRTNALLMLLGGAAGVLDQESAKVSFPEEPKRVLLLTRQKLLVPQGSVFTETEADLAVVSTVAGSNGNGVLIVVDVSNPASPAILGRAAMPPGAGSLNSIVRREDGMLALASSGGGMIVLDPRFLLKPTTGQNPFTAALQATASGLGGPLRNFVADDSGWNATASGAEPAVAFTDPNIRVVTFPEITPFDPNKLVGNGTRPSGIEVGDDGLEKLLFRSRSATSPKISQLESELGTIDPDSHLYVILDNPGIAGAELELTAAAVNSMGQPLLQNPDLSMPTFLGAEEISLRFIIMAGLEILKNTKLSQVSDFTSLVEGFSEGGVKTLLQKIYENATSDKPSYPKNLIARRLSDDPASAHFNTYVAGPIVLLRKDLTKDRLAAIDEADGTEGSMRRFLRASTYCWVGLSPKLEDEPLFGTFASRQDESFDVELDTSFGNLLSFTAGVAEAFFTGNIGPVLQSIPAFIDLHLNRTIQPGLHAFVNVGVIRRPLVVIPGVMGSRLRSDEATFDLWLSPINSFAFSSNLEQLVLPAQGNGTAIEAYSVFDSVKAPITGTTVADSGEAMILHIKRQHGYRQYEFDDDDQLRLDGSPNLDSLSKMPELFLFPYDWRKNNAESATRLKRYADLIRQYHPDGDKIEIIAHSMGGLVSRRFILENPDRVDRLITICSPLLGATKAVAAKRLGDFDDMALNLTIPQPTMKRISRHNAALDQLMPSKALFDLGLRPLLENGWDANDNSLPFETYEYADYKRVLDNFLYRARTNQPTPPQFPQNLFPDPQPIGGSINNETFHSFGGPGNSQDDWRNDPSSTRYVHIVAAQRNASTISRVRMTPSLRQLAPEEGSDVGLGFPPLNFADTELTDKDFPVATGSDPQFPSAKVTSELSLSLILDRGAGDSTVPLLSQTRAFGSERSLNAPSTLMIPILSKGPDGKSEKETSHVGVLADVRCLSWLSRVLREEVTRESMATLTIIATPNSGPEGSRVNFTAQISNTEGAIFDDSDFIWDTGDSGMFVGRSGHHTYAEDGTYTLTCVAGSKDGKAAAVSSVTIRINNAAPTLAFNNPPSSAAVGQPVTFRTTVTDPGLRDPQSFTWDFGDGSDTTDVPKDAFAQRHVYKTNGIFIVTVRVADDDGATATTTHTINITEGANAPLGALVMRPFGGNAPPQPDGPGSFDEAAIIVRGHTADPGDLSVFNDTEPLINVSRKLVEFAKGLLLPSGQSTEQIVIRREPREGALPEKSTIRVKAAGEEITMDARLRYTDGVEKCFRWIIDSNPDQTISLEIPWATITNTPPEGLPALTSPAAIFAFTKNCDDERGPTETVYRDEIAQQLGVYRYDATVVDGDPTTPDGDPTDIDTPILPNDPGPHTDTLVAQVDPTDPCVQSEDLLAVSLDNGLIPITAASGTPHLVVVKDKQGNITVTSNIHRPICDDEATGGDFNLIREEIQKIFQEAVADAFARKFIISIDDIWILEQGSGAALWKGDDALCAKVYKPGQSDNDYELFFPLHLNPARQWNAADPTQTAEFGRRAHDRNFMEGDWYFLPPHGVVVSNGQIVRDLGVPPDPGETGSIQDSAAYASYRAAVTHWSYRTPDHQLTLGGVDEILVPATGDFFRHPQTPAAILASHVLRQRARSTETRRKLFKDITFFPYRREHFLFAIPSLEKPSPFGDDPVGDAGMGRGFLFLKWVLEGAFLPPFTAGSAPGSGTFNSTVLPNGNTVRNEVFNRLKSRRDALKIETYEWSVFQEFAALRGNVLFRMGPEGSFSLNVRNECREIFGDFLAQHEASSLKKVGKSAIRGVLAALADDDQALTEMFNRTPANFDSEKIPSFEHRIVSVASQHPDLLNGLTPNDLQIAVGLKTGDCETVSQVLSLQNGPDAFILKVFTFLRSLQESSVPSFRQALTALETQGRVDESYRRRLNAHHVDYGLIDPNSAFDAGRLAMHGQDPNNTHSSSFTFYINLFNPTGLPTDQLSLTLSTPGSQTISYPQTIRFASGEVTKRLWGEDSAGQSIPNPFVIRRDPQTTLPLTHTFSLSGMGSEKNKVNFNDRSAFESRFLRPGLFFDPAFANTRNVQWVYRGLSGNDPQLRDNVIAQLNEGRFLSPFHLLDGNPDEESEADVQTERQAELDAINAIIADPNDEVNRKFDDEEVALMDDDEKIAVRHVPVPQFLAISTADSPLVSLGGFTSPNRAVNLLVAFEVDTASSGIQYVQLRPGTTGQRPLVRLNVEETEHVFINKLPFRRALLFNVGQQTLNNGQPEYTLQHIGTFTGQP